MSRKPTVEELHTYLTCDPLSGSVFWRQSVEGAMPWFRRVAGKPAFCSVNSDGYLSGRLRGKYLLSHHVVYAMSTGAWCDGALDHVDGNRQNNAISNLRQASVTENNRNRRPAKGKRFVGVTWNKRQQQWRASIEICGTKVFLGVFPSEEQAAEAFDRAALVRSRQFARLNFPEKAALYEMDATCVGRGKHRSLLLDHAHHHRD